MQSPVASARQKSNRQQQHGSSVVGSDQPGNVESRRGSRQTGHPPLLTSGAEQNGARTGGERHPDSDKRSSAKNKAVPMSRASLPVEVSHSTHGSRPEYHAAQTFIADSSSSASSSSSAGNSAGDSSLFRNTPQETRSTGIARARISSYGTAAPLSERGAAAGAAREGERYPLAIPAARLVEIDDISIGSGSVCWMAGPRYVESISQLREVASAAQRCGLRFLRARAWWPWAREEDFDRHFLSGLNVLKSVAREFGLYVVSEIVHIRHLEAMQAFCDVIEVGGPVLSHQLLLSELGGSGKTILMNRASDMTVTDFLDAVNIVSRRARSKILLLESGSRSFDPAGDAVLDLSAIVALRQETNHPVFVDPTAVCRHTSHIRNMAVAAIAAGADGIVVELRPEQSIAAAPGVVSTPGLTGSGLDEMIRHASAFKHTLNALTLSTAAPSYAAEREQPVPGPRDGTPSAESAATKQQPQGPKNVAKLGPLRRTPAAA